MSNEKQPSPGCPDLHGGERADTGAPGELTPTQLKELARLQQQATTGKVRFIPENGCLVDERGDIVADVQPLDEQDCILTQQDGEYLAALWTEGPALLAAARERETLRDRLSSATGGRQELRRRIMVAENERDTLRTRVSALEGALHRISLEAQSSMGDRENMGRIARAALAPHKETT